MNRKACVTALKRLSVETGSLACLGCGYEHNCSIHGCAILNAAVDHLEGRHETLPNPPGRGASEETEESYEA